MYEIIIRKKTIEEVPAGKEWENLGERPLTSDEMNEKSYWQKEEIEKKRKAGEVIMVKYSGYTPEIIKKKEVEVEVLRQAVEDLDLAKVIKAINNL